MSRKPWKRTPLALGVLFIGLAVSAGGASVRSQEPECPPGFVWNRMSGVGCVQENCPSIANAKYSYTSSCICLDGYKACYEPVDYGGFDREQCDPFCPQSRLVACVGPDARCPGEEPPAAAPTAAPAATARPASGEGGSRTDGDDLLEALLDALFGDETDPLEALLQALTGGSSSAPTPGRAAAAGAAAGGGLAAWFLTELIMNLLGRGGAAPAAGGSGTPSASGPATIPSTTTSPPGPMVQRIYDGDKAKQILKDAGILQDLRKLKRDDPNYWAEIDKALEKVKNNRHVKGITYQQGPGGIDEDSIVIVVEEPEYGPVAPPPPPPPPAGTAASGPVTPSQPVQPKPPTAKPVQPKKVEPKQQVVTPPAVAPPPPAAPPSRPGPHTFDDGTPQQGREIGQATARGLQQIDKAISTLEAAKTTPDLLVGAYFDINGTSVDDRAKLDGLIARLRDMKQQIEKGVPFEVDDYGPLIFDRAVGYVWTIRGYGKGIGDVHIVYPRWSQLSPELRAKVIVHELSHYNTGTKDHAYSWQNKFWRLSQAEKLENADSLAEFAMGIA